MLIFVGGLIKTLSKLPIKTKKKISQNWWKVKQNTNYGHSINTHQGFSVPISAIWHRTLVHVMQCELKFWFLSRPIVMCKECHLLSTTFTAISCCGAPFRMLKWISTQQFNKYNLQDRAIPYTRPLSQHFIKNKSTQSNRQNRPGKEPKQGHIPVQSLMHLLHNLIGHSQ